MKELFQNIISKIRSTGTTVIDTSYLKNNSWFYISDEIMEIKTVYIFRTNGELLIAKQGDITKAKWENLVHSNNSLIIEIEKSILYNILYLTSDYLIIQKDGTEHFELFVKQEKFSSKIKFDKAIKVNLIDYAFNDLKNLLNNQNDNDEIKLIEPNPADEQIIQVENNNHKTKEIKKDSPKHKSKVNSIKTETVDRKNFTNGKYEYFVILDLLEEEKISGRILNNNDESDFIIEMQEKEEELIDDKVLCPYCKALNSIDNNICKACNKDV